MSGLMLRLLNMSLAAGGVTGLVLVLRILLKRLPKVYICGLWMVVLFRFLCPLVIPLPFSLAPIRPESIRESVIRGAEPGIETGIVWVDETVNSVLNETLPKADPSESVDPVQIYLFLGAIIWMAGVLALGLLCVRSYRKVRKRIRLSVCAQPGVYESDEIGGAFVMGVIRPAIYLPANLEPKDRSYILMHERCHLAAGDHLFKLAGFLVVLVHWFNPLAWVAFYCLGKDMEMACDERVIAGIGSEERKEYAFVLLHMAERRSGLLLSPTFGESHTKSRIKNILRYQKPKVLVSAVLAAIVVFTGIGLAAGSSMTLKSAGSVSIIGGADGPTSIFIAGKKNTGEDFVPDEVWLSGITLQQGLGGTPATVSIDFASEDTLAFHGDFGYFLFTKEQDRWLQVLYLEPENMDEFLSALEQLRPEWQQVETDSVHREDRFTGSLDTDENILDYAAWKMEDGSIALLAGPADEDGTCSLFDLSYGVYHPDEQIMRLVSLFQGDGTMKEY